MTNPYRARALLAEPESIQDRIAAADAAIEASMKRIRALAAPAEADGPAVPDGREPASVALQPSDGEIMGLMPQQMHDDLAAAVRAMAEQEGIDSTPAKGVLRIILNRHVVDLARAVLARWGRTAAAPVPEPGEVEGIAEWLNSRGRMADLGTRDWYFRAAALLQQQAAPASASSPTPCRCQRPRAGSLSFEA